MDHATEYRRSGQVPLFHTFAARDPIDGDAGIHIAERVKIDTVQRDLRADLDDVLFFHLSGRYVFEDRHRAVEGIQSERFVYTHPPSGGDVVEDDAVFYRINVHFLTPLFPASVRAASESTPCA